MSRRRSVVISGATALAIALAACGGDDAGRPGDGGGGRGGEGGGAVFVTVPADEGTGPDTTGPVVTDPDTTALTTTTAATTTTQTSATMGDPSVRFVEVARIERPVGLAARRDDPSLYIVGQSGVVVAVDAVTGAARTVLDLTGDVTDRGEQGLLGLAFDPAGERAWINYTDLAGDTVIAVYRVGPDGTFDPASRAELLRIPQPFGNHNGGHLEIGPDGMLYIGMGDGGSSGDPRRLALDVSSPLGKLLRIDPRTTSGSADARPYGIPSDNPYVGVDGAVAEIFAIGLRNPWKFTFDPVTGDLWVADVGQRAWEEVNHVPAPSDGSSAGRGRSFGWSAFEGTAPFNTDVDPTSPDGSEPVTPVLVYPHGPDGCSVSGGAVYRGTAMTELSGGYVYGDYCSGSVWALDLIGQRNLRLGTVEAVTAVLPGPDGELYVLSHRGPVYRIEPTHPE